jgi:hypothetical protein
MKFQGRKDQELGSPRAQGKLSHQEEWGAPVLCVTPGGIVWLITLTLTSAHGPVSLAGILTFNTSDTGHDGKKKKCPEGIKSFYSEEKDRSRVFYDVEQISKFLLIEQ